jgi:vacuolar-type H+-ATPase subunit E/Vma4
VDVGNISGFPHLGDLRLKQASLLLSTVQDDRFRVPSLPALSAQSPTGATGGAVAKQIGAGIEGEVEQIIRDAEAEAQRIVDDAQRIFQSISSGVASAEEEARKIEREVEQILDAAGVEARRIVQAVEQEFKTIVSEAKRVAVAIFLNRVKQAAQARITSAKQQRTDAIAAAKQRAHAALDDAHQTAGGTLGQNLKSVASINNQTLVITDAQSGSPGATSSVRANSLAIDQGASQIYCAERLDDPPPGRSAARSARGDKAVKVNFENTTPYAIDLYWVDYAGKDIHYATIAPGGTLAQGTFATHPWRAVIQATGTELVVYTATEQAEQTCEIALKSINSATPVKVKFINFTLQTVEVSWVDYQGQEKPWAVIVPRESLTLDSFLTHPWSVRDKSGRDVLALATGAGSQPVVKIRPKAVRSVRGNEAVTVTFRNTTSFTVKVFWVNYQGNEALVATLPPGGTHAENTFVLPARELPGAGLDLPQPVSRPSSDSGTERPGLVVESRSARARGVVPARRLSGNQPGFYWRHPVTDRFAGGQWCRVLDQDTDA